MGNENSNLMPSIEDFKNPFFNESKQIKDLMKQTNELPLYKLKGDFDCKVVDVYDGDTITIVLLNKGEYEKHKLRLLGYDSPEIKPLLKTPNRDAIIKAAKESKEFLRKLTINKHCIFESHGTDKYGRLLGNLYLTKKGKKDKQINQIMIDNKYGYAYDGGTKRKNQLVDK